MQRFNMPENSKATHSTIERAGTEIYWRGPNDHWQGFGFTGPIEATPLPAASLRSARHPV